MHRYRLLIALAGGVIALAAAVVFSLQAGALGASWEQLGAVLSGDWDQPEARAVINIRAPRTVVAILVGSGLACAGVVMQAILRNPLAEPGVTGVSSGAAVGAVTAIVLGWAGANTWQTPLAAFIGALVVALILQLALARGNGLGPASIILVGVSLNALAGAIIAILIANAGDDATARGAMFWLAGDLQLRTWQHAGLVAIPILAAMVWLLFQYRTLDSLALGEEIAATSGIAIQRSRMVLLLVASLITGAAVAVSGVISFVGLVIPHAVRLILGGAHRALMVCSALGGAIFLVLADSLARTAFGPAVLQTGVVCALVGAPVFLLLVLRRQEQS